MEKSPKPYFWNVIGLPVFAIFIIALFSNLALMRYTRLELPAWTNIPPAPSSMGITMAFLGDKELAYRSSALTLQNFGNMTGRTEALKDYNYDHLEQWFWMEDSLNSISEYVPFLAAYYFGATQNPEQLYPVIDYLRTIGKYPEKEKWRWLGQAIFLARHRLENEQLALDLAGELAAIYRPDMPAWPLQMQAIIASDMGEKEMAYEMMVETLKDGLSTMHPSEINFMLDYICNKILSPVQKGRDALCQGQ
ncbi:MAG: hypothetical protein RBR86_02650 [Pseudobdellovibrionaceae bacterium]|jgi:hypothetical protein|nr:hypothetical protein [Pseudobdellovibrionaceae bacterium]